MRKLLSQLVILAFSGLLLAACTQETPTSAPTSAPFGQPPRNVEVNLFPVEATNPLGASHTITATVKVDGKPVAGVTVTFTISSGPHAVQTFTAITDANGDASFTYTGTNAGVDTIVAEVAIEGAVITSNKARKEWVGEEPTPLGEVFVYPAKFVCGSISLEASPPPPNEPPLKPGNYATAINLYNFQSQDVKFTKKAVIANPQGQPSGATSPVFTESLGAGLALEVDCSNITQMLSHSEGGKSLPAFIKGFVVVDFQLEPTSSSTVSRVDIDLYNTGHPDLANLLMPQVKTSMLTNTVRIMKDSKMVPTTGKNGCFVFSSAYLREKLLGPRSMRRVYSSTLNYN